MCDFINAHDSLINITTIGEYRMVMKNVMLVIKEVHNVERKRRRTARKKRSEEAATRTQKAKALISNIKRGGMRKEEIERMLEKIFGKGSGQEIENVNTMEKIAERIEELSRREEQLEVWDEMRREAKRKQREDRRLNVFWRKNKCFPTQFGGVEEAPEVEETLMFWRGVNNKEVSELWRGDESIQQVLGDVRERLGGRRCRWKDFTEAEFDEVLRCTASWKACGVDSVYSFPIKKCPPIRKAVFRLVKKLVEWNVTERWMTRTTGSWRGEQSSYSRVATGKILPTTAQSPASQQSRRW